MPDKFIGIAEWLVGENSVIANDYSVFKATAFDEAVFIKVLDFFVVAKSTGAGNFRAPSIRANLNTKKLSESAISAGAGAGDLEEVMRDRGAPRSGSAKGLA